MSPPGDQARTDYRPPPAAVTTLSGTAFFTVAAVAALFIVIAGRFIAMPLALLAAEVSVTILGLFVFGSFSFQIHQNVVTYGMLLVVVATFASLSTSSWHVEIQVNGWGFWVRQHLLSFRGPDDLEHADTMLFILGLTLFVSVIAQTRLLEGLAFQLLRRNHGLLLPTVLSVTAVVAVASGILDGVSMVGLTIRTWSSS